MNLNYETVANTNRIRIDTDKYKLAISLAADPSNCKLSYIHQAGCLISLSDKDKKEALDFALNYSKGSIIINTTNEKVALFIRDTYPTYYYEEIPTGYGGKFQYHVCIKNTVKINSNCRNPEPVKPTKPVKPVVKEVIKEVIVEKEVVIPQKVIGGYARTRIERTLKDFIKNKNVPANFVTEFIEELAKNKKLKVKNK